VRACEADIHALGDALLAVVLHEPLHLISVADQIIARLEARDGSADAASVAQLAKTLRAGLHDRGRSREG